MTDDAEPTAAPIPTPDPGAAAPGAPAPGERRLDRPPSDRFREAEVDEPPPSGSLGRALAYAGVVGLVGIVVTILMGGVLAFSAGLLVVAAVTGRAIALAIQLGGGDAITPGKRVGLAIGLSVVVLALGQLGLWWYAGTEGGVLGPIDYLGQAFGVLVPLQFVLAIGFAWWAAR